MFNIILLGITSLLTDISTEMVYPLLPIYLVQQLGVSPVILGFIEGIAESLSSLFKVFSGHFSDKLRSRKPFAIFGYSFSAIGKLFLYLSTNWHAVFAARTIDRFGKGIRTAPRDALIAENAHPAKRGAAFGLHRAMDTIGAATGVLLAYFLITSDQRSFKNIFLISLIPAVLAVLFLFFVKEKGKEVVKRLAPPKLEWQKLNPRLKLFLIFTLVFTLGNSSNQFLLLRAKDSGSSIHKVLLFYLFYNIVYALTAYPAARLSDKIGRRKILVWGYFFYGLVYLGFAMNKAAGNFWFLFGLYGLYIGFTEGVEKALLVDVAPRELKATVIGLHATLVGLGLFPASFLAGLLWKFLGASAPFYFGGIIGIAASICLWFVLSLPEARIGQGV
jgi:MFS family permease